MIVPLGQEYGICGLYGADLHIIIELFFSDYDLLLHGWDTLYQLDTLL